MTYLPPVQLLPLTANDPTPIKQDAVWAKTLSAIPVIGYIVQIFAEINLFYTAEEAMGTPPINEPRFIKAVEIKNQYKLIGMIRDIFVIAATITLIALGIFTPLAFIAVGIATVNIGITGYRYYQNQNMLADVRENGFGNGKRFIR